MDYIPSLLCFILVDTYISLNIQRTVFYNCFILFGLSVVLFELNKSFKSYVFPLCFLSFYKIVSVLILHFNMKETLLISGLLFSYYILVNTLYQNKERLFALFKREEKKPERSIWDRLIPLINSLPKEKPQEDGYTRLFQNMNWEKFMKELMDSNTEDSRGSTENKPKEEQNRFFDHLHADWKEIVKVLFPSNEKDQEESSKAPPSHDISSLMKQAQDIFSVMNNDKKREEKESCPFSGNKDVTENNKSSCPHVVKPEEQDEDEFGILSGFLKVNKNEKLSDEEREKRMEAMRGLLSVGSSLLRQRATKDNNYSTFADSLENYFESKKKHTTPSDKKE